MKLLALDTATEACSAALWIDGEVRTRFAEQARGHADLILTQLDTLLAEAALRPTDLDAIAFGRGPGSFTGVRIAVGVAQGAAFGADLPVVPVSNLAMLAHRAWRESGATRVLAALDARMGEVYWGAYAFDAQGRPECVVAETVVAPEQAPLPGGGEDWVGVGRGWGAYGEALRARVGPRLRDVRENLLCHAQDTAALAVDPLRRGEAVRADRALPVYLRNKVAEKPRGGR